MFYRVLLCTCIQINTWSFSKFGSLIIPHLNLQNKQKVKRPMQDVDFNNIDEFLYYLPEEELVIVKFLRKLVLECMPECVEKLAYNVPFYKMRANVCFIWPGSIKWGNVGYQGVRFGFAKGYLLTDEEGYLEKGGRKQVYWKDFNSIKEIDADLLRAFLFEAIILDAETGKERKQKKRNS